jgi:hypothetical protein
MTRMAATMQRTAEGKSQLTMSGEVECPFRDTRLFGARSASKGMRTQADFV